MSNRTIVEFNHDYASQIKDDPEGFIAALTSMLNSGVNDNPSEKRDALKRYGVSTAPTHHHSGVSTVILAHESGREYFRERFT